ncbi:MAG: hypothetical protein QOF78_1506, partial [Phycisphaerales bacterium]|nr:hypothetical protein [Phycisphaerales bacterium]
MRRITSVGSGNRSVHNSFARTSIGRGKRRRLARRLGVGVESLEARTLLANFYPSPATPDGAPNSLRANVITSNTNGQSDTIYLKAGTYELTLNNLLGQENFAATGDLDLKEATRTVTFKGSGIKKTFIDANQIDRVFQVDPNVIVVFKDLTITGGLAQDNGAPAAPAGSTVAWGGGILSLGGKLTFQNVGLCDNEARGGAGLFNASGAGGAGFDAAGGGLYADGGQVNVSSLTVTGNIAQAGSGAVGGVISSVTFSGLIGGAGGDASGGGLFVRGIPTLTLNSATIKNNHARAGSGGAGGSTVDTGSVGADGGNALGGGVFTQSILSLVKSSVCNNDATAGAGGAGGTANIIGGAGADGGDAFGGGTYSGGPTTLSYTDVSKNQAIGGAGGAGAGGASSGSGGDGGDAQGGGVWASNGLLAGLSTSSPAIPPTTFPTYIVALKDKSSVNGNTAQAGAGGNAGVGQITTGSGGDGGNAQGGGIHADVIASFKPAATPTASKSKAPPPPAIPPAFVIVDNSCVLSNKAIGGAGGSGAPGGDGGTAEGGGIYAGVPVVALPDIAPAVTPFPPPITPILGSVSLSKATIDCNEVLGGDGAAGGGDGGDAVGGGISALGAVWGSKSTVSRNLADGGAGGAAAVHVALAFDGGDGGTASGGGIFVGRLLSRFETFTALVPPPLPTIAPAVTLIDSSVSSNKVIGGAGAAGNSTEVAGG